MSMTALQTIVDPLHALVAGGFVSGTMRPIPLVATRFKVVLNHGLATVSATRIFKNAEETSIEATITFPVPVHAVLFALEARIAGRVLNARAQCKSQARDDYEDAIERGKTAVLHEEVLRGVHMLSVGHVPPGAEVEVSATWTMTLTNLNSRGHMRIPLTVGDIYGRSGLPDSDDLTYGGAVQTAELTVQCRDGQVTLLGGRLDDGRSRVPLNAPIDLEVNGWTAGDLRGRAADGREAVLRVEPTPFGDANIDVAVMIDHSGSMGEICSGDHRNLTKHQAVLAGLQTIVAQTRQSDVIDFWEFDDTHRHVGSAGGGNGLQSLIGRLSGPAGGTEIGAALAGVTALSRAHDVLLITDGKSHALDVQALTRTGRRFSVVLVGEDSLEAKVGHLAALTGGEIFVAAGSDLAHVLNVALRSLRTEHFGISPINGKPQQISVRRAGMTLTAKWQGADGLTEETTEMRAVAALAASIALSALDSESAAQLAEAEGLVTHLTSLVLVDEASAVQACVPAARKIPLPAPRVLNMPDGINDLLSEEFCEMPLAPPPMSSSPIGPALEKIRSYISSELEESSELDNRIAPQLVGRLIARELQLRHVDLSGLGAMIDWDVALQQLQAGDLSALDRDVVLAIHNAAALTEVVLLARQFALDPVALVIGLIARSESSRSRSAMRLAKAIFGDVARKGLDDIAQMLCLGVV